MTKVESFGAFIEVEEGLEGLLPVSEMSWQRDQPPVGRGEGGRHAPAGRDLRSTQSREAMSFSLKQAGPDPWKT